MKKTKEQLIEEYFWKMFKDRGCFEIDFYEDNTFSIDITWGDWKHAHLFADYCAERIGYHCVDTKVTEENGSDCYSATHYYEKDENFSLKAIIKGFELDIEKWKDTKWVQKDIIRNKKIVERYNNLLGNA